MSELSPNEGGRRLRRLADHLAVLADKLEAHGKLDPSAVDLAIAQLAAVRPYACEQRDDQRSGPSGKRRIRAYFELHVGDVVTGQELAAISGVLSWARRVRELREEGMAIDELGGSRYVLRELPME
jgi:hypothetical protein